MSKRTWVWPAVAAAVLVGATLQTIPGPGKTNPPVERGKTIEAQLAVPPEVSAIFARACRNCHSNDTVWPWYGRIAPGSWLVARDVAKARKAMNWSEWGVGAGKPAMVAGATLAAACADIRSGRMPLAPYQVMHPESRLSPADRQLFCGWANRESHRLMTERAPKKLESRVR